MAVALVHGFNWCPWYLPLMARFVFTPTALASSVEFGTLTLAGQGGYPVSASSVTGGSTNATTHWTVTDGRLVPTAAAVSAGYSSAPYELTFNDASTLTVTCPADVRHVATLAEVTAAATACNNGGVMAGKTCRIRPGTYGEFYTYDNFRNLGARSVFEAADPLNPPVFRNIRVQGADRAVMGNVTFRNIHCLRPQTANNHDFIGPTQDGGVGVLTFIADAGIRIENCEIASDVLPTVDTGGLLVEEIPGLIANGSNVEIIGTTIRNTSIGMLVQTTNSLFENNIIRDFFHDGVRILGGTINTILRGNHVYDMIGFGNVVHGDAVQFTSPNSGTIDGVTFEGNVLMLGAGEQKGLQSAAFDAGHTFVGTAANFIVNLGSNTTLDATHVGKIIRPSAAGLTFTVPDPSLYPQEMLWFDSRNPTSVAFTVAGTITGGNVTVSSANHRGTYALRSNGTSWEKAEVGLRAGVNLLTSSITLTSRANEHIFRVDATSGNITVTLPSITGQTKIGFVRLDSTANTVTIQRAGSDPMSIKGDSITSYSLEPLRAATMLKTGSPDTWTVRSGNNYLQGIFGNANSANGQGNVIIRGNIVFTDASWLYRLEEVTTANGGNGTWFGFCRIYNNDFFRIGHTDINSDGAIDDFDGWYGQNLNITPRVAPNGIKNASNSNNYCVRNVVSGQLTLEGWANTYIAASTDDENVVMNLGPNDGLLLKGAYDAIMSAPVPASYKPQTPAEAIAISNKVNAGVRGASYYWDFAAGAKKSGATEPTIP